MVRQIFANSGFINRENSTFLILHLHETLPHGEQILSALESVPLDTDQLADLAEGARIGAVLYLRMSDWALGTSTLVDTFFGGMMEFQTLGERIIA